MKKLKLNPVVLDTLTNEDLKKVYGGLAAASDTKSSVIFDNGCRICTVVVTPRPKKNEAL